LRGTHVERLRRRPRIGFEADCRMGSVSNFGSGMRPVGIGAMEQRDRVCVDGHYDSAPALDELVGGTSRYEKHSR
jgi:hypothetical protein